MPSGELSVQAEKQLVSAEEANFTPLTSAQKAEKKAQETSDRIINEQYRRAVKANIARQEQRSKKDRERWAKLSKEEISKKFNLIYELFSTKAVSTPELLFDGDLTVLDHLIMNDVVDQEKWKEITDVWKGMELSPQDKWESLSLHFKWQAVFAYDSGYGRIYSFLTTCEKLKLSREQLEEAFWEEHKLSFNEVDSKWEEFRGRKYTLHASEEDAIKEQSAIQRVAEDQIRAKEASLLNDITSLRVVISGLKKKSDGSKAQEEVIGAREEELKAKEKELGFKVKKAFDDRKAEVDDTDVLSEDLRKRFEKLHEVKHVSEEDSKPRIEAEKPKVLKTVSHPVVSPQEKVIPEAIDQQYQQALVEREELLTSVEDDADVRVYAVSRKDGQLVQRLLKKGEKPRSDEGTAYGYDCSIRLPPIDTGDAFNNFSGKKIRIFKGSLKVINTSDVEVGVYGEEMHPIEELRGSPKTGEFTFPIYSDAQHLPELVIRHKGESSHFHLTSVTTHFTVED
ncbi:hypothetical protein GS16_00330 [Candidatus Liberibacter solanacearum]|uniref:hypothetical protein n=1 Tax=Candidatus Liberibacter solanacearum TaxID=556287 RepID=UPI000504FE1D|nr:hypothetical protein [Candidatus Liberibacter solanacearum]KGB27984.1 hypothetical protein GS16_00330 [Candidatus Liberibacter solanacearum]